MTYEEFIAESQHRQREYISGELVRMKKASKLALDYKRRMAAIGLHDLTPKEIRDRQDQLAQMMYRVEETHGDTPGQRTIYEAFHEEAAA